MYLYMREQTVVKSVVLKCGEVTFKRARAIGLSVQMLLSTLFLYFPASGSMTTSIAGSADPYVG